MVGICLAFLGIKESSVNGVECVIVKGVGDGVRDTGAFMCIGFILSKTGRLKRIFCSRLTKYNIHFNGITLAVALRTEYKGAKWKRGDQLGDACSNPGYRYLWHELRW